MAVTILAHAYILLFPNDELGQILLVNGLNLLYSSGLPTSCRHHVLPVTEFPSLLIAKHCLYRPLTQLTRLGVRPGRRPFCFVDIAHGPY